jgi:hypothetical protein
MASSSVPDLSDSKRVECSATISFTFLYLIQQAAKKWSTQKAASSEGLRQYCASVQVPNRQRRPSCASAPC